MRVLLDENMPHQLRAHLPEHEVSTAVYAGFGGFKNGKLLKATEDAGYGVLLTGDLSLEYQQNLTGRKISIVVLGNSQWPVVRLYLDLVAAAVDAATPGSYAEVKIPFR